MRKSNTTTITAALTLLAALTLAGCASQRSATYDRQERDSTEVVTRYVTDTMRITLRDTIHEASQRTDKSQAYIILQGGTYNAKTGEMTGVCGVTLNTDIQEVEERNEALTCNLVRAIAERDSAWAKVEALQEQLQEQKQPAKHSAWHTFTDVYFVLSVLIIIACVCIRMCVRIK